jgi:endonuclease YncB( thermonuclease family)
MCNHGTMLQPPVISPLRCAHAVPIVLALIGSAASVHAEGCAFADLGEGHVAEIIDGRSFRLSDGREIRLTGIELATPDARTAKGDSALARLVADQDVILQGEDDAPDRYGRQAAFVVLASSGALVQELLLAEGEALVSVDIADKSCAGRLLAAEATARVAKKATWASQSTIKNAESPDDILTGIGRFAVVEGRVLSVRQAGATTYLNFGRNWTRDFAATISRRMMPAIESAGLAPKSLENRRIRVRGWVEAHGGPRIDVRSPGQIELLSDNQGR